MDPRWQNLSDPIFHCAQTRGDAPALIEGPERLSYRALAALIAKTTVYLHELGIGQGQRIGVALTNSIDHVILQFALFRIGATLVELPVEDSPEALAATARQYGIRTIFTEAHAPRHRISTASASILPGAAGWRRRAATIAAPPRATCCRSLPLPQAAPARRPAGCSRIGTLCAMRPFLRRGAIPKMECCGRRQIC